MMNRAAQLQQAQASLAQAHQQETQRREQANFQHYASEQDDRFTEMVAEDGPETLKEVQKALPKILEGYGIDPRVLRQLYDQDRAFRSAQFQAVLYDAVRFRMTKETMARAKFSPVSKVQKPGVTSGVARSDEFSPAMTAFKENPSAKSGAALLQARRAAARNR
jgi:hypothetical protein